MGEEIDYAWPFVVMTSSFSWKRFIPLPYTNFAVVRMTTRQCVLVLGKHRAIAFPCLILRENSNVSTSLVPYFG